MADGNKPEKKFKAGSVSATVWKNSSNRNGREAEFYTVSLDRSYKVDDDWKKTSSLRVQDIADAQLVLRRAYEFVRLKVDGQSEGD